MVINRLNPFKGQYFANNNNKMAKNNVSFGTRFEVDTDVFNKVIDEQYKSNPEKTTNSLRNLLSFFKEFTEATSKSNLRTATRNKSFNLEDTTISIKPSIHMDGTVGQGEISVSLDGTKNPRTRVFKSLSDFVEMLLSTNNNWKVKTEIPTKYEELKNMIIRDYGYTRSNNIENSDKLVWQSIKDKIDLIGGDFAGIDELPVPIAHDLDRIEEKYSEYNGVELPIIKAIRKISENHERIDRISANHQEHNNVKESLIRQIDELARPSQSIIDQINIDHQ